MKTSLQLLMTAAALVIALSGAVALAEGAGPTGDPARGAAVYVASCGSCHSLEANRVGPAHRGVYGRKAGSAPGYDYSRALRKSRVVWNAATLDRWLQNPRSVVPGTKMAFSLPDAGKRADIIAYLKQQSARAR